jgi:ferredoxin-nitrite reductase
VGGGLSSKPFLAQQLDIFVLPEQVVDMAVAITRIYRDYGFRQKRHMTRLKFLVADWGVERFKEKLIEVYGSALPSRGEDGTLGWNAGYYYGVQKQKQRGLNFIGLNVPIGRLSGEELHDLARISDEYGDGTLRTSVAQNIIIANIPTKKLNRLQKEATIKRITPQPKAFVGYAVSCTGNEYCNLALVETKERMRLLAEHMDHVISDLDTPVRMHMVGCPNSCGQRQVADIGFQGALVKTPQGMRDAFEIYLGGTLGPGAQYNEKLNGRVKADDLGPVVEQLVNYFKAERTDGETFHSFYKRVGATPFQERLDQAIAQLNN